MLLTLKSMKLEERVTIGTFYVEHTLSIEWFQAVTKLHAHTSKHCLFDLQLYFFKFQHIIAL